MKKFKSIFQKKSSFHYFGKRFLVNTVDDEAKLFFDLSLIKKPALIHKMRRNEPTKNQFPFITIKCGETEMISEITPSNPNQNQEFYFYLYYPYIKWAMNLGDQCTLKIKGKTKSIENYGDLNFREIYFENQEKVELITKISQFDQPSTPVFESCDPYHTTALVMGRKWERFQFFSSMEKDEFQFVFFFDQFQREVKYLMVQLTNKLVPTSPKRS